MAVFAFLLYFSTAMVIEKKQHLVQSPRKYAILTLISKKISAQRELLSTQTLSPVGGGHRLRTPHPHWHLQRPFPPTSTPGSAYALNN